MGRKKNLFKSVLFVCLLFPAFAFSQFRVVGYVSVWGKTLPALNDTALSRLTHLNIAFVNPDSTGELMLPQGFDSLIQQAHDHKIKVLMAIGGGSYNPFYAALLGNDQRAAFSDRLLKIVADHQLDGIDVDLEGEAIDKNYDAFIADLYTRLRPAGKLLTAALATWNANLISTSSLKKFDFVNVMSYDQTGPWRPNEPGPHSTYAKAEEDLHYWTNTRGFSKKKINLGVPFYGYCFGTTYGESMSYGNIVDSFPDAAQQDMVVPQNGGIIYYNGIPSIKSKTKLAMKDAGGIMIWQLLQDAQGEKSLLGLIDETVNGGSSKN